MRLLLLSSAACLGLVACTPTAPNDVVGFESYDQSRRSQVDAQLEGRTQPGTGRIDAPENIQSSSLDQGGSGGDDIAAMAAAAIDGTGNSGPVSGGPAPAPVTNSVGISNENDFDAVANQRSIEEDAALVQQNQAQYTAVAPEPLPSRPTDAVNVVAYALSSTNNVGEPVYSRSAFASKAREQRNCTAYASDDLAQEAFLQAGGPQRDREGLDADGDGFACGWDPTPFRRSRG
ncbi:hypothetical protein OCH239_06130 [Roseivivax halodurans JCM 10272]|uniref:Excalibur calcium-binding domain-containing protein n=1 Tax=Roseivivax halodurans JCM 10272 TaxID=1449350 RepID=X7EDH2_9RHOB|nr:hypothetical protein [Roseivivax halodurans]ETX13895.1 hypothetical protein OCH239_06130 [Roseivivax halodurans JCM 10272]